MVEDQEQKTPETGDGDTEVGATIEDTKQQLAMAYLNFLDKQKGGMLATGAGLGVNFNPLQKEAIAYLTTNEDKERKGLFATLGKNIKKKIIEQVSGGTVLEYNKASLAKMKGLITQYKDDQAKLQELMVQIQAGTDPTIETTPTTTSNTPVAVAAGAAAVGTAVESSEKMSDRRKAVLANVNAVLEQDKRKDIRYNRGGHSSIQAGLDCGGLIVYTYNQAGLKVDGNGRSLFQKFPSKRLEVNDAGAITTDTSQFQAGDVLVFDALDATYYDTPDHRTWMHTVAGSEGQQIHPHHFAFIKSFNREKGTVNIIESNGSQGVTESECSISHRLNKVGNRKSALHAIHVDYDALEKIPSNALAQMENLPGAQVAA